MDDLTALIATLRACDITVMAAGGKLRFDGPPGVFTPKMKCHLHRHKADLLAYLNHAKLSIRTLQREVKEALDRCDLSEIIDRTQMAFAQDRVSHQEAKQLALLATIRSREWSELGLGPDMSTDFAETLYGSLSDLFRESPLHRVRSRLLSEDVLFAANDAHIPPECDLVVYRAAELAELTGMAPKLLRKVHALKVAFDGVVEAKAPNTR